ncbi:MAG TPA: VacJ family lipoprotein [Gammaproteobacteria bacterium]|nr:VacJ family lipoprotein [Gammaproteobacteria bacterium]
MNKPYAFLLILALGLTGCAATPDKSTPVGPVMHPASEILRDDVVYAVDVYDPWEGMNRGIYKFNAKFDQHIFLPALGAYETILPGFAQKGLTNFFSNMSEIRNVMNSILQLKLESTLIGTSRFLINTTVGIGGFWDPSTDLIGLYQRDEDLGQTLGYWGFGQGPYMVLPIFGPSSFRDGFGFLAEFFIIDDIKILGLKERSWEVYAYYGIMGLDMRRAVAFRYYDTGSPFEYELVRMLYTQKRKFDIAR